MTDINIKETDCFGLINNDSISYDDFNYFCNSLLLFELSKIKCFIKGNKGIIGIELIYKNREIKQEFTTINVKTNDDCFEQEFIFKSNESIINITIFRKVTLQGFEITTNLKRSYRFGLDNGEKISLNEFSSGKNMVIGFYAKFDKNIGITALGFYYIDRKLYLMFLYYGFLCLRAKLNNNKYYNSIKGNITKMDNENKAILKTCLLPKSEFMGILKYIINY